MNTAQVIRRPLVPAVKNPPRYAVGVEIPAPAGMRYLDVLEFVPKGAQFFNRTNQRWELSQLPYSYDNPRALFEKVYIVPANTPRHVAQ